MILSKTKQISVKCPFVTFILLSPHDWQVANWLDNSLIIIENYETTLRIIEILKDPRQGIKTKNEMDMRSS